MSKKAPPVIRVLIADDELLLSQKLAEFLTEKSFVVKYVRTGQECLDTLREWNPDFIFYDLMLPDLNALSFLKEMTRLGRLGKEKTKVFVFSGHNDPSNVRECMRLGASDYITRPYRHPDLLARLVLHLYPKREAPEVPAQAAQNHDTAQYYIHLTDLTLREALKGAPVEECLHNLTGLLGISFHAVRVSVVKCDLLGRQGAVIASSDKRDTKDLKLDLVKYPEILYVLNNDKLLALDNLAGDETMYTVARQTKSIQFNAMIVAPIRVEGRVWGVVSIRLPESKKKALTEFEIRYAQLMAHVMGLVIIRDPALMAIAPNGELPVFKASA